MSEELIIKHCSPTLAGLKAGSMFTAPYECPVKVREEIRQLNQRLRHKGLRMIPLRFTEKRVLLYLYRKSRLNDDLNDELAKKMLLQEGYHGNCCTNCIAHLASKIKKIDAIPHEIGLFLGYPSEDIHGFIENKACGYTYSGCWKVYGDPQEAIKLFESYKKCTEIYCAQWAKGVPLEKLAVAG